MAGLVPAIHVLVLGEFGKKDVDARHKAGHDGLAWVEIMLRLTHVHD
jgi:hypothetical protein